MMYQSTFAIPSDPSVKKVSLPALLQVLLLITAYAWSGDPRHVLTRKHYYSKKWQTYFL